MRRRPATAVFRRRGNEAGRSRQKLRAHGLGEESKLLLRVDEAAFVLNISESEVRNYVDEGRLEAHPEPPLRITVESVKSNIIPCTNSMS